MFICQCSLEILADLLVAPRHRRVSRRSQCGVKVIGNSVHLVRTVLTVTIVAVVSCLWVGVGRVDIIVSLHLVFIHVDSVGVRLRLDVGGVACDVIGGGGGPRLRLVGVAASVRLGQVGHAASVGVHVSSVAATGSVPVGVVARSAVLHAGLAGVGGAVVEDVGAVAAPGRGHDERWYGWRGFRHDWRLGLQAPAPLTEVLLCGLL